jgi:hypothetical protein
VVVDAAADPDAWNRPAQWRTSGGVSGSPGAADPLPPDLPTVLITEALTRPDGTSQEDWVEVCNPGDAPVDLGGWWLTDDFNTPGKFRAERHGRSSPRLRHIDESCSTRATRRSAWRGRRRDLVVQCGCDGPTHRLRARHRYGAADNGVPSTLSRQRRPERFVAQTARSPGADNPGPRVGPVVINEIMYHPPDPTALPVGKVNTSNCSIPGSACPAVRSECPDEYLRLRGGARFDFLTHVTLATGEYILLVGFDPTTPRSPPGSVRGMASPSACASSVPSPQVDNAGDPVELQQPTLLATNLLAHVVMDKVAYATRPAAVRRTAWGPPASRSACLRRRSGSRIAAPPTAGASNAADLDGDARGLVGTRVLRQRGHRS